MIHSVHHQILILNFSQNTKVNQHDQISAKYTFSQNTVLSSVLYFGWACLQTSRIYKLKHQTAKRLNYIIYHGRLISSNLVCTEIVRTRNITSSYCHLKLELGPETVSLIEIWYPTNQASRSSPGQYYRIPFIFNRTLNLWLEYLLSEINWIDHKISRSNKFQPSWHLSWKLYDYRLRMGSFSWECQLWEIRVLLELFIFL